MRTDKNAQNMTQLLNFRSKWFIYPVENMDWLFNESQSMWYLLHWKQRLQSFHPQLIRLQYRRSFLRLSKNGSNLEIFRKISVNIRSPDSGPFVNEFSKKYSPYYMDHSYELYRIDYTQWTIDNGPNRSIEMRTNFAVRGSLMLNVILTLIFVMINIFLSLLITYQI